MSGLQFSPRLLLLPAELRLEILDYVFPQDPNVGVVRVRPTPTSTRTNLQLNEDYSSSAQLEILLTCRQLRDEATALAFRRTLFIIRSRTLSFSGLLRPLQDYQLENLRNIWISVDWHQLTAISKWAEYAFDNAALRLQELTFFLRGVKLKPSEPLMPQLVGLLRRLRNVPVVRFVEEWSQKRLLMRTRFRTFYDQLVGLMLKEDHYQRYDAQGAPHVESTWWEWSSNTHDLAFELVARPPKPFLPEAEYMQFVAPLVTSLMAARVAQESIP